MKLPLLLAAVVAVSAAVASLAVAQMQYPRTQQPAQPPAPPPAPAGTPAPAAAPAAAPAPAAEAASTAAPAYPAPNCVTPNYPGKSGTDAQVLAFNRDFKAYGDCIRKYVDDARALSNAAIEAGNKVVLEYNKYTEDTRKQIAADKDKAK
jgi:hypothetical protein